ncbi:MAG: HD domain-containing protein [Syntrophales bacterium]
MTQRYRINEEYLTRFRSWFINYVSAYPAADPVTLKKEHSLKVCREILSIGSQLDLDTERMLLAETVALFHDIGRFEQYSRYRTFVDCKSENHADLGVKVLREKGILDLLDKRSRDVIFKSILNHNRLRIPEGETESVAFFSRLLRDADKIDIYRVVTNYYRDPSAERSAAIELDLPDTPDVSDEILHCLRTGRLADHQRLKSLNDFKLLQLGWVYDFNFPPSLRIVRERGYLKLIRESLPQSGAIDNAYAVVIGVLEKRIAETD